MSRLVLVSDNPDGSTTEVAEFGQFTESEFHAEMAQLMQARQDWDALCNWITAAAIEGGFVTEAGLTNPGYQLRSFTRFLQEQIRSVQKSTDPAVRAGWLYTFLDGTYGTMIKSLLKVASAFGPEGRAIEVTPDSFLGAMGLFSEVVMRQLWRDPQRQALLAPLRAYFTTADPLDA